MSSYLALSLTTSASASENPLKSTTASTLSYDVAGLKLDVAEGFTVLLDPYEERAVASTRKPLSFDATTQLQITQPYNSLSQENLWRVRWTGTGTNPNFRVRKALTVTNTTTVTISRLSDTIARVQFSVGIGVAPKVDDVLLFEKSNDIGLASPFNAVNQGIPVRIVGVNSNYLDVEDAGVFVNETAVVLGIDYLNVLKVFSSTGAQVTDELKISSSVFNYGNRGAYKIVAVSADYIDIEASSLVPETVSGLVDGLQIFTSSIYYVALKAKGPLKLLVDEKELNVSLLGDTAIFASSVTCSEIVVKNTSNGNLTVEGLWCAAGINGTSC